MSSTDVNLYAEALILTTKKFGLWNLKLFQKSLSPLQALESQADIF